MIKPLLWGFGSYVPGLNPLMTKLTNGSAGTGGTNSARYCYSVWMRHLTLAKERAIKIDFESVAELGPGDSIGIGLMALLTGSRRYYSLDVVKFANEATNLMVFEELVKMMQDREPIPGNEEFPRINPPVEDYGFPSHILDDDCLKINLNQDRLDRIRRSITGDISKEESLIIYVAPWYDSDVMKPSSVDMIFSQAVLEHIDMLEAAYRSMYSWLKPGGFMSHMIDFSCHSTSNKWNGHWTYSDWLWALIRGKRPYLLNRQPHSVHTRLLDELGFETVADTVYLLESSIERKDLADRFQFMTDEDMVIKGAFMQSRKTD